MAIDLDRIEKALKGLYSTAEEYIKNPEKVKELMESLKHKERFVEKLNDGVKEFPILISMIKDYFNKKYTEIPTKTIIALVATILYISNPFDLIPDFIPGLGVTDDIAVIGLCIKLIKDDLDRYKSWKIVQDNIVVEVDQVC